MIQPIEADTEDEARKIVQEATATARDVVIEAISEDPEELVGVKFGDEVVYPASETAPVEPPTKH